MTATITTPQGTFPTNTYPGICYDCGERVGAGTGSVQKVLGKWITAHAGCQTSEYNLPCVEEWVG